MFLTENKQVGVNKSEEIMCGYSEAFFFQNK